LKPGAQGSFRFTVGTESRELAFGPLKQKNCTIDAIWKDMAPVIETHVEEAEK
jgi:hypothetical protein